MQLTNNFTLPTTKTVAENYNPKLMILFGQPKSGKSTIIASLDNTLIIDLDNGYRSLEVMKVTLTEDIKDFWLVKAKLKEHKEANGKNLYKNIVIDNASRLEEMAIPYANALYRATPMGTTWGVLKDENGRPLKDNKGKYMPDPNAKCTTQLPNGAGYGYLREAMKELLEMFIPYCETLILICHVKDKMINKNGTDITELAVDLTGKTASIIEGMSDAIGLVYREGKNTIISFEGGEGSVKEARPLHLRGKKFIVATSDKDNNISVDMSKIFI